MQRYPEWDRLIARLRPDWCAVFDEAVEPVFDAAESASIELPTHPMRTPLRKTLKDARPRTTDRPQPAEDGDRLDPNALVRARIARRLRLPAEARVHLRAGRTRARGRAMLLVDQSASSADAWGGSGRSLLQAACEVAALAADSWHGVGVLASIAGFCSSGRQQVQLQTVKGFADPLDAAALQRLAALRSRHSTRLGAAIRHATRRLLVGRHHGSCQLVLITDGQPHDIDVHDPQYLVDDARRAVQQALRQGVQVACIVLDPAGLAVARRIFGARRVAGLAAIEQLPRVARVLAL
ncbi:MAG: VWA domain-containing protein [Burkholderiaceae bacterium]